MGMGIWEWVWSKDLSLTCSCSPGSLDHTRRTANPSKRNVSVRYCQAALLECIPMLWAHMFGGHGGRDGGNTRAPQRRLPLTRAHPALQPLFLAFPWHESCLTLFLGETNRLPGDMLTTFVPPVLERPLVCSLEINPYFKLEFVFPVHRTSSFTIQGLTETLIHRHGIPYNTASNRVTTRK